MRSSKSKHRRVPSPRASFSSSSSSSSSFSRVPAPAPLQPACSIDSCIGTIAAVDTSTDAGCSAILWMSESAMVSASLRASQLVSVSVITSNVVESSNGFHLEPLARLCSRFFGITVEECKEEQPGEFCALAVAWPCRKLSKNGLRLSRQLANTLGCSDIGAYILVRPLSVLDTNVELKNVRLSVDSNRNAMQAILQECEHVWLRWCPPNSLANSQSSPSTATEATSGNFDDMVISAQSTMSTSINQQSPLSSQSEKNQIEPLYSWKGRGQVATDPLSVSSILDQKNSKGRELLETFAAKLLSGRFLLKGNFVAIPICGHICVFRVLEVESSKNTPSQIVANGSARTRGNNEQDSQVTSRILTIYLTGIKTSVSLLQPMAVTSHLQGDSKIENKIRGDVVEDGLGKVASAIERVDYSGIGGLSEQIAAIREIINLSLLHPERLLRLGLQPTRGVLLYGPPGTGKTSLALASACEAGISFFKINGPEVVSEYYGESEQALRTVFNSAQKATPSMVFIDELDAIAPQRQEGVEELAQRIVATLLTLMDGGVEHSLLRVLVIAATNRLDAIDPALRRPGRFDYEIEIGVPSPSGRCEILNTLLCRMSHTLTSTNVHSLASATHGFVGADLMALCNEAGMVSLRRYVSSGLETVMSSKNPSQEDAQWFNEVTQQLKYLDFSKEASALTGSCMGSEYDGFNQPKLKITMEDFEEAKSKVRPSAMREVMLEVPEVHWSDVGGQDEVKQQLQEAVEWPQKYADAFMRIGAHPPRGVLMYGPPGCSKTLMARAVATEAGLNFIAVKGPELFSKWVGESEKAVHAVFERARAAAPSIVFFDEIDGLAVARDSGHEGASVGDRVMSQLLVEMDGLNLRNGVTVIAATNRPDNVDSALLRPGRFDRLLYVGAPNDTARREIFEIHTSKMPCGSDVSKRELAARTNGYTGADIAALCREAGMAALEESLDSDQVWMRHFETALNVVQPSHSGETDSVYAQFQPGLRSFPSQIV